MWLTLLAISIGLLVGWALGGTVGVVRNIGLLSWPFLAIGLALRIVPEVVDVPLAMLAFAASSVLLILFCLRNLRIIGLGVLAVGIAVNLFVSVLNWGMPVDGDALVGAGILSAEDLASGIELRGVRHLETSSDFFTVLDDHIPVRLMTAVVSFGDLIVLVGMADLTANLLLARRQRLVINGPRRRTTPPPRQARQDLGSRPRPSDEGDREIVTVG